MLKPRLVNPMGESGADIGAVSPWFGGGTVVLGDAGSGVGGGDVLELEQGGNLELEQGGDLELEGV